MQVNSSYQTNSLYNKALPLDPIQDQKDKIRESAVGIVGQRSKQDQIEIYVESTRNANEQYENTSTNAQDYSAQQDYVENYNDFAQQARRAEYYQTLVENGVTPSDLDGIKNRPSTQPIPELPTQEDRDTLRQAAVGIAQNRSTQSQIDAYRAGAQNNSNDNSFETTQAYVQNYTDFANQVRRSEYINTYIENAQYGKQFSS